MQLAATLLALVTCPLSFFSPSTYRPISAALLRVTTAMAGAVCGQTLPVVVKAQTISCSAGPLFLPLSCALLLIVLRWQLRRREGDGRRDRQKKEINECQEKVDWQRLWSYEWRRERQWKERRGNSEGEQTQIQDRLKHKTTMCCSIEFLTLKFKGCA